jgi:hypothetical protein
MEKEVWQFLMGVFDKCAMTLQNEKPVALLIPGLDGSGLLYYR